MAIDFVGCWLIEVGCKWLFADMEPKAMITQGRERREKRRAAQAVIELAEKAKREAEEQAEKEKIELEGATAAASAVPEPNKAQHRANGSARKTRT